MTVSSLCFAARMMFGIALLCLVLATVEAADYGPQMVRAAHATSTPPPSLGHLNSLTNTLASKVADLSRQLGTLKGDVNAKTAQINTLNSQIRVLQRDVEFKRGQIRNLTTLVNQKSSSLSSLAATVKTDENRFTALDNYVTSHVGDLTNRTVRLESPVGFEVQYTNDSASLGNFSRWYDTLLFDNIRFQAPLHIFNSSTGVFTAPSSGTYVFFLTIQRSDPNSDHCIQATVLRNRAGWVTSATACPTGYAAASNLGITWLREGDTVQVVSTYAQELFGFIHTQFAGFKITPR